MKLSSYSYLPLFYAFFLTSVHGQACEDDLTFSFKTKNCSNCGGGDGDGFCGNKRKLKSFCRKKYKDSTTKEKKPGSEWCPRTCDPEGCCADRRLFGFKLKGTRHTCDSMSLLAAADRKKLCRIKKKKKWDGGLGKALVKKVCPETCDYACPTPDPTQSPTAVPSSSPTSSPSSSPTTSPSSSPTTSLSSSPTTSPSSSSSPTTSPSSSPTTSPTSSPTASPSSSPTTSPSSSPTASPTSSPTASPSSSPSSSPTTSPSSSPTASPIGQTDSPTLGGEPRTLQEHIIRDMMPESSPLCVHTTGSTTSSFAFASSQEESNWWPGYPESTEYGSPWSNHEEYVFAAKMMHVDESANRTWTMRVGTGGNIYGLIGPMGETVAPQRRVDSPWIDDVWHTVGVDPGKFMIHGAGSYQYDKTYKAKVGIPLTDVPFYAPNLGKYCKDEEGECGFAAWSQIGPVPTDVESPMFNFNRYKDCGNGIIEHTSVVHNNMGNDYSLSRLDAPFGSVRFSNLRDVVLTDAATQSEEIFEPADLGNYAFDPVKRKAADTMGYAIFAEDLPSKLSGSYPLPRGIKYTVTGAGCRNLPNYWPYKGVQCEVNPTTTNIEGTRNSLIFRGTKTLEPLNVCSTSNPKNCITSFKFIKFAAGDQPYCRAFGNSVSCRLDLAHINNFVRASGDSNTIEFKTDSGKSFKVANVVYWNINGQFIFNSKDESLAEINAMIIEEGGNQKAWHFSIYRSSNVGGDVSALNGAIHWCYYNTKHKNYWLYFYPDEVEGVSDIGGYIKEKFPSGTKIEVLHHPGKRTEDNTALAHVYGTTFPDAQGITDGWPLLIAGNANGGDRPRDSNVYNIVTTANRNTEGGIHHYRQYFVMDRFSDISEQAKRLASEVTQDNYNVKRGDSGAPVGQVVHLYKSGNSVGASVGNESCGKSTITKICSGSTTPKADSKALLQIVCGSDVYIGSDPYYFSPDDFDGGNVVRPYICRNDSTARGIWTVLGFFPEGACATIEIGHTFNDSMCHM